MNITYSFISVFVVSLISFIGVLTFYINRLKIKRILIFLVSLATGGLLGDALIHLVPEAFEKIENKLTISILIILGMVIFFILEKFVRWRHCHIETSENHPHPFVSMNIIGDGLHNFIDGIIIAASYLISIPLGITTTLAVILHEIPQEIGDFGVLIKGELSIKKALLFNFLSALLAILGAILTVIFGPKIDDLVLLLIPITAGGFLYIAGSDLIPELHSDNKCEFHISQSFIQLMGIFIGVIIMIILLLVG